MRRDRDSTIGGSDFEGEFVAVVQKIIDEDKRRTRKEERKWGTAPTGESVDMDDARPGKNNSLAGFGVIEYFPPPPVLGLLFKDENVRIDRRVVTNRSAVIGWRNEVDPQGPASPVNSMLPNDAGTGNFTGWSTNFAQFNEG